MPENSEPTFTLAQIEQWCLEYDQHHGWYPEHAYEGLWVLDYIRRRIAGAGKDESYNSYDLEDAWRARVEGPQPEPAPAPCAISSDELNRCIQEKITTGLADSVFKSRVFPKEFLK